MAPNTIILKGSPIRKEGLAGVSITPGKLLQWFAGPDRLMTHGTSAGFAVPMFALEEDLVGDEIGTAYASGSRVLYATFRKGDEVYAWLASGENVARGAGLESDGSGNLQAITGNHPVAAAAEDKDNSGGGSAVRIRVEVV